MHYKNGRKSPRPFLGIITSIDIILYNWYYHEY